MLVDDQLYKAYLEEMEELEFFRSAHSTLHHDTPIELLEDPDTLRLVESLAFFAARSRLHGLRKIAQMHQTLFRQYFSFLVNPLPTIGLLHIQPSLRIPETLCLPEGAELIAQTYDKRKATFQTMGEVKIPPLFFESFNFVRRIQGGYHLDITYKASHVQNEDLKQFTFYINHLNSFLGSIRTYFALCRSIETIQVYYDETNIKNKEGAPCSYSFSSSSQRKLFNHPLERIRSELHFPEQEMFFTISLPEQTKKWQQITFSIELSGNWPENLLLTQNSLTPFVVPIVNLKTAKASPIECNGTKDSYPILYPNPVEKFSLHTIVGVYEIVPGGMRPLKPGILDKRGRTYEVDFFDQTIFLDLPHAFQNPRKVSIDALWTQLWFADYIDQEYKLKMVDEEVSGLSFKPLQLLRSHEIPLAANDPKFLLRILSLKNQNRLHVNEIWFLINSLKNLDHSYFKIVPSLVKDLRINHQLDRTGVGPTIRYEFQLKEWDGKNWEIVVIFFKYVNSFLNCWLSNFHVETMVFFPHMKTPLIFKGGSENELPILARNFFLS